jgi:hypothetical protein
LNKRREVVVQKKADAAVVSCWIFQPFESKCARVSRSWLAVQDPHNVLGSGDCGDGEHDGKAWFQSERIAKQSAPSFIQMPHEQSWTDRQSRCNWDALPAASREYFSK